MFNQTIVQRIDGEPFVHPILQVIMRNPEITTILFNFASLQDPPCLAGVLIQVLLININIVTLVTDEIK